MTVETEELGPDVQELERVTIRFAGDSGDGMQLTGTQFTRTAAVFGNDISTLPDFPAEIRAPGRLPAGVSGFQISFSSSEIHTPGDQPDVLVAMNPAALKTNIGDLPAGGALIVNKDAFTQQNLNKAAYASNPLTDGSLKAFTVFEVPISTLNERSLDGLDMTSKQKDLTKNFFALGLMFWLYERSMEPTIHWIDHGHLSLAFVRVTGGTAFRGGGIATDASGGTLLLQQSLIDHNSATNGAGVANIGQTFPANLTIYALDDRAQHQRRRPLEDQLGGTVNIYQSTIARNTGTGLAIERRRASPARSSPTTPPNCGTAVPTNGGGNLDNTATCGFGAAGSSKDPLLGAALTDAGGQTDVLTIPANSPAIGIVQPCRSRSTSAEASACSTSTTRATRARTSTPPRSRRRRRRCRRRPPRPRPRRADARREQDVGARRPAARCSSSSPAEQVRAARPVGDQERRRGRHPQGRGRDHPVRSRRRRATFYDGIFKLSAVRRDHDR